MERGVWCWEAGGCSGPGSQYRGRGRGGRVLQAEVTELWEAGAAWGHADTGGLQGGRHRRTRGWDLHPAARVPTGRLGGGCPRPEQVSDGWSQEAAASRRGVAGSQGCLGATLGRDGWCRQGTAFPGAAGGALTKQGRAGRGWRSPLPASGAVGMVTSPAFDLGSLRCVGNSQAEKTAV